VFDKLSKGGVASTICYWDVYAEHPAVISKTKAGALRAMSNRPANCYFCVKAPLLNFDIEVVRKVLTEARRLKAVVHFDAVAPDTVDPTFDFIAQARQIYSHLGCTLPGRWLRSVADVERAIEMKLRVRVVEGQSPGTAEVDHREGFLNVVERLCGRAVHVAVATDNPALARLSLRRLKNARTPCELELLYGLPQQPLLRIARDFGVRARMYVPYGQAGLPYRLKQGPNERRIIGWFMRDPLRET